MDWAYSTAPEISTGLTVYNVDKIFGNLPRALPLSSLTRAAILSSQSEEGRDVEPDFPPPPAAAAALLCFSFFTGTSSSSPHYSHTQNTPIISSVIKTLRKKKRQKACYLQVYHLFTGFFCNRQSAPYFILTATFFLTVGSILL